MKLIKLNIFLGDNVPIHNGNYIVNITNAYSTNYITIMDKKGNQVEKEGYFIAVELNITQNADSSLKKHIIDRNDFKLKNHTGVFVPLNDIMGAIGWDAIDVHIDEKDGVYVMSSTEFSTVSSIKDYHYVGKEITPGNEFMFVIYFELPFDIQIGKDLVVLEIDFYFSSKDYKKGTDIILLLRPDNLR